MADRRGPTPQRIKAEDVECYQFLVSADETPARTGVGKDTGFHGIWYHRNVVKHAGVIADRWEEEPRRTRAGGGCSTLCYKQLCRTYLKQGLVLHLDLD